MKSDRFLILILAGIGLLAVLAVVVFFVRQGSQAYTSDASPRGIVQNYVAAVGLDNFDLAYQYLAEWPTKPDQEKFQQSLLNNRQSIADVSVQVGETSLLGDQASVAIILIHADSNPFGSTFRQQETASLVRQNGAWKISQLPFPFWDYAWSAAVPPVKPPQINPAYP